MAPRPILRWPTQLLTLLTFSLPLLGADSVEIPSLERAGLVALQLAPNQSWVRERWGSDLTRLHALLERELAASGRFTWIHPSLVQRRWETPEGRQLLRDEFEIDAYAIPSVLWQHGQLFLAMQLIDSGGDPILEESRLLGDLAEDALFFPASEALARELIQGILNRLPLDAVITSVQGAFATLSAGTDRGFFLGQELVIERVVLTERHPALKTWRRFERTELGTAQIVDITKETAILRVTQLSEPDSLRLNDGVRSDTLRSRRDFVQSPVTASDAPLSASTTQDDAPLPAPPQPTGPEPEPVVTAPQATGPEPEPVVTAPQATGPEPEPVVTAKSDAVPPQEQAVPASDEAGQEMFDNVREAVRDLSDLSQFGSLDLSVGARQQQFQSPEGRARTQLIMPRLFNHVEVAGHRKFSSSHLAARMWYTQVPLDTGSGSGFGLRLAPFAPSAQTRLSDGTTLDFGPYVEYEGVGIDSGFFGGHDLIVMGGRAHAAGWVQWAGVPSLKWYADVELQPLAMGWIGFEGSKRSVRSHLGLGVGIGCSGINYGYAWQGGLRIGRKSYADDRQKWATHSEQVVSFGIEFPL